MPIDEKAIIDRIGAEPPSAAVTVDPEATSPDDTNSEDAHLGEAFDAFQSGNKEAFITAMKACLSGSNY